MFRPLSSLAEGEWWCVNFPTIAGKESSQTPEPDNEVFWALLPKFCFTTECHELVLFKTKEGLPRWLSGKESSCQCPRRGFSPWIRKVPWRRKWQPTLVFLPGNCHGQRSLGATVHGTAKSWTRLSNWAHTKWKEKEGHRWELLTISAQYIRR